LIYTVGYYGWSLSRLIAKLDELGVTLLVDLRTKPFSRHNTDFNKPNLERVLGTRYVWRGWCLGGKSGVRQPRYSECLQWLRTKAETETVCVMCMERNPDMCHRKLWVAEDLKKSYGLDATHL
jgi:uncharacterized protein (DUF488 family)